MAAFPGLMRINHVFYWLLISLLTYIQKSIWQFKHFLILIPLVVTFTALSWKRMLLNTRIAKWDFCFFYSFWWFFYLMVSLKLRLLTIIWSPTNDVFRHSKKKPSSIMPRSVRSFNKNKYKSAANHDLGKLCTSRWRKKWKEQATNDANSNELQKIFFSRPICWLFIAYKL